MGNKITPANLEDVQYSVPFCVAAAMIDGAECLLPVRADLLERSDIVALACRVRLTATDDYDRLFPAHVPARVRIRTRDHVYEREVRDPRGEPSNPMDLPALRGKFATLAAAVPAAQRADLADAVLSLGATSADTLLSAIDAAFVPPLGRNL